LYHCQQDLAIAGLIVATLFLLEAIGLLLDEEIESDMQWRQALLSSSEDDQQAGRHTLGCTSGGLTFCSYE
jgi:hypothetical protein